MRRKSPDKRKARYEKLILGPPGITAVSDHALAHEEYYLDTFDLTYRLGPVLDIIRHPKTRTPMCIAVYGGWGTGKTSAMKWLHGLLEDSNKSGASEAKMRVKPVWFYPWKYRSKEDVWRGLISEVIINSIDVSKANRVTIANAAKQFGMFLGRGFVHVMAGLTLKAKSPTGAGEAELDLSRLEDIIAEYREISHPEKAYLNEFESSLQNWVSSTLLRDERMVIFIDDLDRCMPDVALEVLEALKLYLNIEKLVFVVGVDRGVIDSLVSEYYKRLGLPGDKSRHYLAKMFQIEVELAPHERQISGFLDQQLDTVEYWRKHLEDYEREIFRKAILQLAEQNPREVKRLINSALMAGAGFLMLTEPDGRNQPQIGFNQALQYFFIRKVLDLRHTRASLLTTDLGDRFFRDWSGIVSKHKGEEQFPRTLEVPKSFIEQQRAKAGKRPGAMPDGEEPRVETKPSDFDPTQVAGGAYDGILTNNQYAELLPLLADELLGELMQIPYPAETKAISAAIGAAKEGDIIREAIARQLKKKPDELRAEDYANLQELDLSGTQVSDIEPLRGLSKLQEFNLWNTQVSDIEPLRDLSNLQMLYLSGTQVSDIEPLRGITNLQWLDLSNTQVSDIEPLRGLTNLKGLFLPDTQVSDIEPLRGLSKLQELYLSDTQVSDIEPLGGLSNLQGLFLGNTQVSDIEPLRGLSKLQDLFLSGTQVSEEQVKSLKEARPGLKITV